MTTHFYVSCRYNEKAVILLGPLASHYKALQWLPWARREVRRVYHNTPDLPWYAYGTCSSEAVLPAKFNYLLEQGLPKARPAVLPNRRIPLGSERRLTLNPTRPFDPLTNPIQRRTWRVVGHSVELGHCLWIEPVGSNGFRPGPQLLALQYWEAD